jgi:5-methylcytosine-specific restriction enzyme A
MEKEYRRSRWRKYRKQYLLQHPRCVVCGRTDNLEVDHKIRVSAGGSFYDPSNHQTLCITHHSQKNALERGHVRKRLVDDQGNPLDKDHHWNKEGEG